MVLGLVSGSRIRSSRVETDSVLFERRFSGLKSNCRPRSSGRPRMTAASVRPTTQLRSRSRKWSSGASHAQPTGARSPTGLEHGKQRRQQGDRGQERDDHAGPGDQPEFGETHIGGRQKRVESGRDRGRGKQKRPSHAMPGMFESLQQMAVRKPLRAIADAELDAEVDAKADEQHGEGDRDEVQRADHHQAGGGGETEADREIDQNREDDPGLPERQPQDQENDEGPSPPRSAPRRRRWWRIPRRRAAPSLSGALSRPCPASGPVWRSSPGWPWSPDLRARDRHN